MKNSYVKITKILISVIIGAFFTFLIAFHVSTIQHSSNRLAEAGILDLTDWNFQHDGIVSLKSGWRFFWKEFINSPAIYDRSDYDLIQVPSAWNWKQKSGKAYDVDGYATYSLDVLLSPKTSRILAAKIPHMATAYKLNINDVLVAQNGTIGKQLKDHRPDYNPQIISFMAGNHLNVVLHLSNFSHITGGQRGEIEIGTVELGCCF